MEKTVKEEKHKAKDFLRKSDEFLETARLALQTEKPDSAVGLAVLCAISASDAFTVHFLGLRSASQNHQDALTLLESVKPGDPGIKAAVR